MTLLSAVPRLFVVLLSLIASSTSQEDEIKAEIKFVNVSEKEVMINWYNAASEGFVSVGGIAPGLGFNMASFVGHKFSYDVEGITHTFVVKDPESSVVLGPDHFRVKCSTTEGDIHANIIPNWSPLGAARFLHLVRIGYFNGCALNRVVKNFLTQFGMSSDFAARTTWRQESIADDTPLFDVPFQPGYLSYAGSGPSSRTTEIFVVMPDVSDHQLKFFGTNPWETPFGYVEPEDLHVVNKWYSYGDVVPFGDGPDSQKIYHEDGYDYLSREFPKMSYIKNCEITSSESKTTTGEEF